MLKTPGFLLAAGLVLALAFTFSCSGDDGGDTPAPPPLPSSSSSTRISQLPSSASVPSRSCEEAILLLQSSSSDGFVYCTDFVEGTKRKHLGMDKEQFCDKRDGNIYAYVKIGTQTWMAENLDYNAEGSIASVCTNEDPEAECHVYPYGRLYDFMTTVKLPAECCSNKECKNKIEPNHQGICPEGWHIPTYQEWVTLYNYAGLSGSNTSAQNREGVSKLKATTGWNYCFINSRTGEKQCLNPDANGTDDFGLALLPSGGGLREPLISSGSNYAIYIGAAGYWWTATEKNRLYVSGVNAHYQSDYVSLDDEYKSHAVYSVRCVKTE